MGPCVFCVLAGQASYRAKAHSQEAVYKMCYQDALEIHRIVVSSVYRKASLSNSQMQSTQINFGGKTSYSSLFKFPSHSLTQISRLWVAGDIKGMSE